MSEVKFDYNEKTYFIKDIDREAITEAQKVYIKTFRKAVEDGALMEKSLNKHMKEQGLWDDTKESLHKSLVKQIADCEFRLKKGGIKLSEARDVALKLSDLRDELLDLINEKTVMRQQTAEGQAEAERFNFLISALVCDYITRKPVFKSYDDFISQSNTELAAVCAAKFANKFYGLKENLEDNFTEVKFLKRFGYIDEKNRLVDKETGKLIDRDGNFIDEEGYRIDENGVRIDINNNPVLETDVDTAEFLEG